MPWEAWGPAYTRCLHNQRGPRPFVAHGSQALHGDCILDFNQRDIARDVGAMAKLKARGNQRDTRRRTNARDDILVPGFPGRIVVQPTVLPANKIFEKDVKTYLPYRVTKINLASIEQTIGQMCEMTGDDGFVRISVRATTLYIRIGLIVARISLQSEGGDGIICPFLEIPDDVMSNYE